MRHRLHYRGTALSPMPGSQRMLGASDVAALVTLAGVALQTAAGLGRAPSGAIALTPVAVAADQDLHAATRAQKESGRSFPHEHPRQIEGVLDGIVRECNTAAAPVIDTV
jgi:hypothetical protein